MYLGDRRGNSTGTRRRAHALFGPSKGSSWNEQEDDDKLREDSIMATCHPGLGWHVTRIFASLTQRPYFDREDLTELPNMSVQSMKTKTNGSHA